MYFFFLKKNKGDSAPFIVTSAIQEYISLYGQNDVLVALPGYMSTNLNTIGKFCSGLKTIIPHNRIFFTNGMNGNRTCSGSSLSISKEHINNGLVNGTIHTPDDHSKSVFFYSVDKMLKAVLIGSSNLSFNTYYKSPAPKGEFDVFIIDNNIVKMSDEKALQFKSNILEDNYISFANNYDRNEYKTSIITVTKQLDNDKGNLMKVLEREINFSDFDF